MVDVSDIIDSDNRIMGHTTVRGGVLTFDFGDGSPLRGQIDGKLDRGQIITWCNAVRSSYREREDRKENPPPRPEAAVRSEPVGSGTSTEYSGGSGVPVAEGVEGVKAAMEAGIESSLAAVGRQLQAIEEQLADHRRRVEQLHVERQKLRDTAEYLTNLRGAVGASRSTSPSTERKRVVGRVSRVPARPDPAQGSESVGT